MSLGFIVTQWRPIGYLIRRIVDFLSHSVVHFTVCPDTSTNDFASVFKDLSQGPEVVKVSFVPHLHKKNSLIGTFKQGQHSVVWGNYWLSFGL